MGLGTVLKAYSDQIKTLGFTENTRIDDPDYQPLSTAHKSFYVQGLGEYSQEQHTANYETTNQTIGVSVLLRYPNNQTLIENEEDNWDLIDGLKKGLYAFGAVRHEAVRGETLEPERRGDFKLFRLVLSVVYDRSMAVT